MAHLYAIVGSMERARLMLQAEVPYLQLRFKEQPLAPYREEIRDWGTRFPATHVVINDDLDEALAAQVWGVHLGQEDVLRYAPERLRNAPLCLGISTHDEAEIALARGLGARVLGFGPLFETSTKPLTHAPQGVERLRQVVRTTALPIIAIGGIGEATLDAVADTGVAMVAMISYLDRFTLPAELRALQARLARP